MGFRQDAYARVFSVDNKGKYSTCNLSISRKNKETDQYEVEFQDGYVRFVGKAHDAINSVDVPSKGLNVKITSCDVTRKYDAESKKTYINYVVFGIEVQDGSAKGNSSAPAMPNKSMATKSNDNIMVDDDVQLPF